MANHVSHAALPYPILNARFTVEVPYLDADGDPTDPTTPDTEVSKDGNAFADCAEEVSTVSGSNGFGYLTLTGAELNASMVALAAKVASGPKATLLALRPRVLAVVASGTLSAGSAGGGTLGTALAYDVTGCFVKTTGGTGGGGTGGANNQARKIITYNTGTGAFTVSPNWETTPDNTTTYEVLLPEGVTLGMLQALNPATAGRKLVVDANGLGDSNMVKAGPTGSGTAQTTGDIFGRLGAPAGASMSVDIAAIKTDTGNLITRIPSALFAGITSLAQWLGLIAGKQTGNSTARTELRATGAGSGTFDETTDSLEAGADNLAKVPKSDGSVAFNATAVAGIQSGLATSTEVTSIQNNTRCVRVVPDVIERPDSGSVTYRVELLLYDAVGNMEAPDSAPTLALVNQAGTDRSSRLDSTTGSSVSTGRYRWLYTADVADTLEQLVWAFSVVEGGATRIYGNQSVIVDTTAVDFTSSDRTTLNSLATEMAKVPKSDSNVTWNATAAAQIQNEANDALVANHLDHLLATAYDPDSKPGVSDALLNELVESDGGVSRFTANALEEAPGTPLSRVEFEISVKSTAGDAAQLSAWLTIGGELVDIEELDATPTLSVTVREHGSEVDLFTATGDVDDLFNSRFEIEQALPNFEDDRQYAADVAIDVDGTVYRTSHVFTVQGA